jgi:hypothetical protein
MQGTSNRFDLAAEWRTLALLTILTVIELLLIIRLFTAGTDLQLLTAIVIVAVLILVATTAERLRKVSAGPQGISTELDSIREVAEKAQVVAHDARDQLEETNRKVQRLFVMTMAEPMFHNLKKLSTGHFGPYEMSLGLERELRYLRDVGYVQVPSVSAVPKRGDDLSQHVSITEAGRDFVQLREQLVTPGTPTAAGGTIR